MEGVVVLANLLARWEVVPVAGEVPVPEPSITLRPSAVMLRVHAR
jgi:hypothetical protein